MKYEIIKGSEKDFEGAPEWATECVWNDKGSESFCYWLNPKTKTIFNPSWHVKPDCWNEEYGWRNYVKAERLPITELVWSGAGVPCVGQKVMTKSGEGIIDYVGSGVIVYSNNDGQWSVRCDSLDYSLSAIRSPEDVARNEAIQAMRDVVLASDQSLTCYESLYDAIAAGKIPCVTKTPTVSELMRVTENATREDCEAIVKMLSGN